jgi:hypothetical protein
MMAPIDSQFVDTDNITWWDKRKMSKLPKNLIIIFFI